MAWCFDGRIDRRNQRITQLDANSASNPFSVYIDNVTLEVTEQTQRITGSVQAAIGINLRPNPSTCGDRIIGLAPDTEVEILGYTDGGWYHVYVAEHDVRGWILGDLLSIEGDVSAIPYKLQELIEALVLQSKPLSITAIQRKVAKLVEEQDWEVPSYQTVRRIVQELDPAFLV